MRSRIRFSVIAGISLRPLWRFLCLFYGKCDTLTYLIYFQYFHYHFIIQLQYFAEVAYIFMRNFKNMNQSILFHTDINKSAEACKVRYLSGNDHAHRYIVNRINARKLKGLRFFARIKAWLL